MPDFGRPDAGRPANGGNGEPSFDDIRRSDSFIDALASGQPIAPQDPADAQLAALLGGWRDESRWPPSTGLVSEEQAVSALTAGLAEKPEKSRNPERRGHSGPPKHNRRGLSVIGTVAAATLFVGGFGAVVAGAGPGDALYGLRSMLFGESKQVRDDAVALAARTELNQVQEMISRGDWQQAQEKLVAVSTQVASIGDQQQKQELLEEFNDLSAKVVERNPEATAAPGIIYTVPPEATELVPAVAPPSSEPATSSAETTSPATSAETTSGTPTTSGTDTTSGTATTSEAATTSGTATTTPTTTGKTTATTTPTTTPTTPKTTTAPTTTSPAQQSQAATTPTSAAPSTPSSAIATTTAAPSPAEATQTSAAAEATETPEPAEATGTTESAEATGTTESVQTTTERTVTPEQTAEQSTAEPETVQEEPVVTTTAAVPVS